MAPTSSRSVRGFIAGRARAVAALAFALLAACSAEDASGSNDGLPTFQGDDPVLPGSVMPATPAGPATTGAGGTGSRGVGNYDRPLGMPIGQGATGPGEAPPQGEPAQGPEAATNPGGEGIVIPVFEAPDDAPPCSGCVELQILVNDINQRDDFVFSANGLAGVTRVVWTIIVPFNSDQLFVQPFVDDAFGTYTDLDANAFTIDTPAQLVHTLPGAAAANSVGLAIGSSGAWTGDMVMSLFVDSVTIEANGTSTTRSFDASLDGLATRTNANQPRVVYHP